MYVEKQIHSGCMVEKIKRRKLTRNERPRRKKEKMSSDDQKLRNEVNRKNRLLREVSANFENILHKRKVFLESREYSPTAGSKGKCGCPPCTLT